MRNKEQKRDKKREDWLDEIIRLKLERDKINERLDYLRGISAGGNKQPTDVITIPVNFPYLIEVENCFKEKSPLRVLEVVAMLKQKFPNLPIDRVKVQTTITYLTSPKKNILVKEPERSLYSLKK